MINTIHVLILEQLGHRREQLRLSLERFEHSRERFLALTQSLQQRRAIRGGGASGVCTKLEAPLTDRYQD